MWMTFLRRQTLGDRRRDRDLSKWSLLIDDIGSVFVPYFAVLESYVLKGEQ